MVGKRVVYMVKKTHEGKPSRFYIAYDFKTGIQLCFSEDKECLKEFLLSKEEDIENIFSMDV